MKRQKRWFPHDDDSRLDAKILELREQLGDEYAYYLICLWEVFRSSDGYRFPHRVKLLAATSTIPENKIEILIAACKRLGLIKEDTAHYIYSASLLARMEGYEIITEKRRAAARARWSPPSGEDNPIESLGPKIKTDEMLAIATPRHIDNDIELLNNDVCICNAICTINNNNITSTCTSTRKIVEEKKPYGEFGNVFFTEEEHRKLFERVGGDERNMARLIERLGCWEKIGTKKSHYRAALSWGVAAVLEERTKLEPKKITLYSDEIKKRNEETIKRFLSSND